jgi:penicillin-binding protein 2
MTLLFCGRLWWLQIYQGEHLGEKARSRYLRAIVTRAPRGEILDRNGKVLATNEPSFNIALFPAEFSTDSADPEKICKVIGIPRETLEGAIAKIRANKVPLFEPVRLVVGADFATVTRVLERSWELPGIIVLEEPLRRYPHGKLAAHVLGHVGAVTEEELKRRKDLDLFDWTGKMGLERVYDKFLQGEHGREIVEVDARGAPIRRLRREPAQPGQVLVTTLDLELQKVAEAGFARQERSSCSHRPSQRGSSGHGFVANLRPQLVQQGHQTRTLALAYLSQGSPDAKPSHRDSTSARLNLQSRHSNSSTDLRQSNSQDAH